MDFDDLLASPYEPRWQNNRQRDAGQRLVVSLRPLRHQDQRALAESIRGVASAKGPEQMLEASAAVHAARVEILKSRVAGVSFAGQSLHREQLLEYAALVDELVRAASKSSHLREGYRAEELREECLKVEPEEAIDRLLAVIVQLQGGDGGGEGNS